MSNTQRHADRFVLTLAACVVSIPLAFAQGTDEQTAACSGDAFTLCRGDIPDVAKITACMRAHKAELSSRCRVVFDAASPKAAAQPKAAVGPAKAPAKQATKAAPPAPPKAHAPKIARAAGERSPKTREASERIEPRRRHEALVVAAPRPRAPATERPESVPSNPPPEKLPGLAAYRAGLLSACEKGLIDPYTCRSSLEALKTIE